MTKYKSLSLAGGSDGLEKFMEIITQTLNTKGMTVRLIADSLNKICQKEQGSGKINLSLDLTSPEYIQVTMVGKHPDSSKPAFAHCQYIRGKEALCNTNISLEPSRQISNIISMLDVVSGEIEKRQFEQKCYEAYQLNWLISHGYSLNDLYNSMIRGMKEVYEPDDFSGGVIVFHDIDRLMELSKDIILHQNGLGHGGIFVCKDEFLCSEYKNSSYMKHLLEMMPCSSEMKKKYEHYVGCKIE